MRTRVAVWGRMNKGSLVRNAVDANVGRNVSQRRRAAGILQKDLAICLGVSVQLIRKYESGGIRIGASRLAAIAAAIDVPVASLIDRDEQLFEALASSELVELTGFIATKEGLALNRAFQRIQSAKTRRSLLALLKGLVEPRGS